ncbi:hypothetical protein C1645_807183 [Glomus cerebriforme]|uniref:WW domain-containing protein n=1 Tax=Glomus cerebriforme TaxID=658196 RepID=A0A397SY37_9GLOM|nr:hypothetical protein C1645_807183 [Glomus cerebriforme]
MNTRPLPPGWVSQWEPNVRRYFYVDTTKNPPVITWDDPRDLPPPYKECANKMPVVKSTSETYSNYSTSSTYPSYPPSVPKVSTAIDSTSTVKPKKHGGFLSKLGLGGSSHKSGKPEKPNKYSNISAPIHNKSSRHKHENKLNLEDNLGLESGGESYWGGDNWADCGW